MRKQRGRVYVYQNKNGTWRVEIRRPGRKRTTQTLSVESEARAVASEARKQFEGEEKPVSEAIDAYLDFKTNEGLKPGTIETSRFRLGNMFPDPDLPLAELHAWCAQDLYDGLRERTKSVSTHRNTLNEARRFCKWVKGMGWLSANPFKEVEGMGKRNKRKPQLTIDESRALGAWCLARPDDIGATATLCCLLLALRAGEICSLTPRSLDDGGRIVRITEAKTEAGIRLVEVPEVLRGRLPALVAAEFDRHWVTRNVKRACRGAKVLEVGAHSLRGTHASLATSAGATSHLVASTLGHASTAVTEAHYTKPEALAEHRAQVALKVLAGGRS